MSDDKRLLVNVFMYRESSGAVRSIDLTQHDLIASLNRWRDKYCVPVKFEINWIEKGVPIQPEVCDILVDEEDKGSFSYYRPRDEYNAEADFIISLVLDLHARIELDRQVATGPYTDDSLHWALGRWFVNKDTKISSRLAALLQYERLSLRIETGYIIQLCQHKVDETSYKIVKYLEEWNKQAEEYKAKDDVISKYADKLEGMEAKMNEMSGKHSVLKNEIEKKDARIVEISERNNQNEELIRRLEEQVKNSRAELEKREKHEAEILEQLSEMEEKEEAKTKEIQHMTRRIDFLQRQTQEKQEMIHQLEKEKEGLGNDMYDLAVKKRECRELSHKYQAALNSITAWNEQVKDLEVRLKKDNKESTEQLLESVDQIWQGQKDEILSSIENTGDHVVECLKPHREPPGFQPHTREKKTPFEDNDELKNIYSLLSKRLGDSWREMGRALGLSSRCLDDIKARYGRYGNEELVSGVLDQWDEKGNPTMEGLFQALKRIGRENILGPPMTDHQRDILQSLYPYLTKQMMEVELLFPYLRRDKILTSSQIEMILQGHGRFGKIENLLKMLPDLGCRAFDGFVHALEESGQVHIAEKLREADSRDPYVVESAEIEGETVPKVSSEETGVKVVEGNTSCDLQVYDIEVIRQEISYLLRLVKQIDDRAGRIEVNMQTLSIIERFLKKIEAKTGRIEGFIDEQNTTVRQTSSNEKS